jgi:hypothetical protein
MAKENEVEKIYRQANYIVDRLLYEKELSDSQLEFLNEFVSNYYTLLDNHLDGKDDNESLEKLQIYEMVLNEVDRNYEELKDLPATKIIYEHVDNHNKAIENKFDEFAKEKDARILQLTKENQNGFGAIALIVGATIILGIGLGALLWFIR